jgi:phosphomevalonate kinase
MRAKAPGKVVLSGAYSVLEGAPAIVAAVNRYVTVDSGLKGDRLTDEVKAAGLSIPYWFDASELRVDGRKLGLGSSAAILVATLAAQRLEQCPALPMQALVSEIYPRALEAHRIAQGGGSGIDVAASCYGGVLEYHFCHGPTKVQRLLPMTALCIEVWSSNSAASTAGMLAKVRVLAQTNASSYRLDIAAQADAAEATALAWTQNDWAGLVVGLSAQRHALERLGTDAKIPIVSPEVRALADIAEQHGAVVLPAGAGGGDIALYVGRTSSRFMARDIAQAGHARLPIELGAEGVSADTNAPKSGLP